MLNKNYEDDNISVISMDLNMNDEMDPFFDKTMRKNTLQMIRGEHSKDNSTFNRTELLTNQGSFNFLLKHQKSNDQINKRINFINQKFGRDRLSNEDSSEFSKKMNLDFNTIPMSSKINKNKRNFFELATKFKGVCLARCSPSMKSLVTEVLCEEMNKVVLAVGDGGNDVGMIQIANIGVGIQGKEGNQAALAADFNITQFKYSKKNLFLVNLCNF